MQPIKLCLLVLCGVAVALSATTQKLPEISEEALEKALNDRRYLQRQLKCALGEASCDPVGRRIKTLAPQVLKGQCNQCSPNEMKQIQKVLAHVQKSFPKEWQRVLATYAG